MQASGAFSQLAQLDKRVLMTIIVAALGYFVDIFDLLLFSIVRVQSLKDLGVPDEGLLSVGITLINSQMAGLLVGGILWGVLGDRHGRLSVLFGSILLYSAANLANGFATSVEQYAVLRFIAGLGLAGELGAGVTLASELLPKEWRGLGTTFIAAFGVLGATAATLVAEYADWRAAYIVGGVMGLALLVLRINVQESGLFKKIKKEKGHGNVLLLFRLDCLKKYLAVILVGAPIWCTVGLFITFTPEFAKDLGMAEIPSAGRAVLSAYIGLSIGGMLSGVLSQYLKSRRKAVAVFLGMTIVFVGVYVLVPMNSLMHYYLVCGLLGIGTGYWGMFVQMGAEQFGTNIRATAATSIPNVVRGLTIPMTFGFHALIPYAGVTLSGVAVMSITVILAVIALYSLKETFHTDLDYVER